jgi:hypothetical protein
MPNQNSDAGAAAPMDAVTTRGERAHRMTRLLRQLTARGAQISRDVRDSIIRSYEEDPTAWDASSDAESSDDHAPARRPAPQNGPGADQRPPAFGSIDAALHEAAKTATGDAGAGRVGTEADDAAYCPTDQGELPAPGQEDAQGDTPASEGDDDCPFDEYRVPETLEEALDDIAGLRAALDSARRAEAQAKEAAAAAGERAQFATEAARSRGVQVTRAVDDVNGLLALAARHRMDLGEPGGGGIPKGLLRAPGDFTGRGGKRIESWLEDMGEYLSATGLGLKDWVVAAATYLGPEVRDAWRLERAALEEEGKQIHWSMFCRVLKQRWGSPDEAQRARVALDSLVMGKGTVHAYVLEFDRLSLKVKQTEEDKLYRFRKGLRPDLLRHVTIDPNAGQPWRTYAQQRKYALTYANALAATADAALKRLAPQMLVDPAAGETAAARHGGHEVRPAKKPRTAKGGRGGGRGAGAGGRGGGAAPRDGMLTYTVGQQQFSRPRAEVSGQPADRCTHCFQAGHRAAKCPNPKKEGKFGG